MVAIAFFPALKSDVPLATKVYGDKDGSHQEPPISVGMCDAIAALLKEGQELNLPADLELEAWWVG